MTEPTPRSASGKAASAKASAAKATPAKASAAKAAPMTAAVPAAPAVPAVPAAPATQVVAPPAPVEYAPPAPPAGPAAPSVLERLRRNQMGALLGALVVALALGLLLSLIVPDSQLLLALVIFGVAEAAAVGFTVRYLTVLRGLSTQLTAFVAAAIGVHLLATTGVVYQKIGDVDQLLGGFGMPGADTGLGYDDSLLVGLWTPTVSTGAILAGLVAAIIAGWGPRVGSRTGGPDAP